jgi:hypothetical protein
LRENLKWNNIYWGISMCAVLKGSSGW